MDDAPRAFTAPWGEDDALIARRLLPGADLAPEREARVDALAAGFLALGLERGARIGILDNHKEFADIVLRGVANTLAREQSVQVTVWRKDYLGKPSPFAREMAASCDAVINGVGH